MTHEKPRNFNEFWPVYVTYHRDPRNRKLHFIGTALSFLFLFLAAVREELWFLVAAPVTGYGFAWFGHFFCEGNKPATFWAPLYSLLADWKMFALMLNRRMDQEVERVLSHYPPGASGASERAKT